MRFTVLGRSAACPNPGEACSGYLVTHGDVQLVLDCGTGCVGRLRQLVDFRQVSAIIVSHMHFDHFADLIPYTYGLKLGIPLGTGYCPHLYLPPGGRSVLNDVVARWHDLAGFIYDVFHVHEFDPDASYRFGPLAVGFVPTRHYVPSWGIRVTDGERTLAYSSDAGPSEQMADLAANVDLFVCEAALKVRTGALKEFGHLTAREAGEIALAASARRLLLTHLWQEHDLERMVTEAADAFRGPVELAQEMKSYLI